MGNPKKKADTTIIVSEKPIEDIALSPVQRPRLDKITIDMTGWDNGVRKDRLPSNPDTHPYSMGFWDAKGVYQVFTTDNMKSNAMHDMLVTLRENLGAFVTMDTKVEVITPRDCLGNHTEPGALPYGCRCEFDVSDFNKGGIDIMPYGVTYDGAAGKRLESVLDEICHQYAVVSRAEAHTAVKRGERFTDSIYDYYEKDQRNAKAFQKYLDSLPKDMMGVPDTGVPFGVDPKVGDLEL